MPVAVVKTFVHFSEEEIVADEITHRRQQRRAQTTGAFAFKHVPCLDQPSDSEEDTYALTHTLTETTAINDDAENPAYVVSTLSCSMDDMDPVEARCTLEPLDDFDEVGKLKTYDPFEDACYEDMEDSVPTTPFGLPPKANTFDFFENPVSVDQPSSTTSQEDVGTAPTLLYALSSRPSSCDAGVLHDDSGVPGILGSTTSMALPQKMAIYALGMPRVTNVSAGLAAPAFASSLMAPMSGDASSFASAHQVTPQRVSEVGQDKATRKSSSFVRLEDLVPRHATMVPPPSGSKSVSCSYLPGGIARIRWLVDARRLSGHDTTLVSPAFSMDLPGCGQQDFKLVVHSAYGHGGKGGAGFRNAKGRGRMELKCEVQLQGEYDITITKVEGSRLGVDLASQDGEPWGIQSIGDGLVMQWNQENPDVRVLPGDRILQVNGVSGNPSNVRAECARNGTLRMKLQRSRQDSTFEVSFGVGGAVANPALPAMRGTVVHRFSEQSCCGLRQTVFDFLSAVDKSARKVAIHVEVAPAAPQ